MLAIAVALLSSVPAPTQTRVPIDPALGADFSWLLDQSSWQQDLDLDADDAEPVRRGHFAVGNGWIIATMGEGEHASTLEGIRLSCDSPSPAQCDLVLAIDGGEVRLPRQHLRSVRGANFVLSEDQGRELSLLTVNYAEPASKRITRWISVRNESSHSLSGLTLCARLARARGLSLAMSGTREQSGQACSPPFDLAPGARRIFILEVGDLEEAGATSLQSFAEALQGALTTRDWWQEKLAATTTYDSDRTELRDLIADWKVKLLVLRDARSGAIRAPNSRSGAGPRGGTLLLLLRYGLWDEARDLLMHAMAQGGASNWSLLEHYWYWRATHDRALIRQHWKELRAGLDAGAEERAGWTLRQATLALLAHHCAGLLAGILGRSDAERALLERSREIMTRAEDLLWLEAEGRFAPGLDALGMPMRAPRAEQNYFPLWAGWTYASGMRSQRNLASCLDSLWVGPRRSGNDTDSGRGRGEIPGMLLAALTAQGQAERTLVIEELLAMAEPAGEWSAFHDARGSPMPTKGGALDPAVAGLNLDAILFALTGLRGAAIPGFAEHDLRLQLALPKGTRYFTVKGAAQDGRVLNLYLRGVEHKLAFDLVLVASEAEGGAAIPVAVRSMGDTHLGWLWDAASRVDATGRLVTPRRFSASSPGHEPTDALLPEAYRR